MIHHKIFIFFISILFLAMAIVFCFFPRSVYSKLERRDLAEFPEFCADSVLNGALMRDLSAWFSDTEPYREEFMTLNMAIKSYMAYTPLFGVGEDGGDDAVTFIAGTSDGKNEGNGAPSNLAIGNEDGRNPVTTDEENARMGSSGILVVGNPPTARALMIYGAPRTAGSAYAGAINEYKRKLGEGVKVYCMPIPTSIEFYCPKKADNVRKPQIATISHIYESLDNEVVPVDCYTPLSQHATEDIYLRTDHHWAPLGAYYAAEAFAQAAGVPFEPLDNYDRHVVHDFVGTMYGYSKDISIKKSPEDFVYFTPKGVEYETTYINYTLDKNLNLIGQQRPYKGNFFMKYRDGSGAAYSTFMGGDSKITQVKTSAGNSRRLLIIKDSFGNAIPGYLFFSFQEVHVVDFRYFTYNLPEYVGEHKITDVLFANGIFNSCGSKMPAQYRKFLAQQSYNPVPKKAKPAESKSETAPSLEIPAESEKSVIEPEEGVSSEISVPEKTDVPAQQDIPEVNTNESE